MSDLILEKIKPGQILYCNLIFKNKKGQKLIVKEQILGREYHNDEIKRVFLKSNTTDALSLSKWKIKEDVTLVDIEILKNLGMKNYGK